MKAIRIEPELTERDYEGILNDLYGLVNIGEHTYSTGNAVRRVDPIAFRCGKVDYEDTLDELWKCTECHETYDSEDEANECCTEA